MKEELLISHFGNTWYQVLKPFLESNEFSRIGYTLANMRETAEIYPSRENIFRCFRETSYNSVRVVMLAMDPYNDSEFSADGLAFSNRNAKKISPSLRIIFKEIEQEYPEEISLVTHGKLDPQDLTRWAHQGVLLLNTALSVEKGKAGSHLELWKPFTTFVLKELGKKNDLVWLLLGKDAQKFSSAITNPSHSVIVAPHPAAETYRPGAGFLGSDCFKKVDEELEARNKARIIW